MRRLERNKDLPPPSMFGRFGERRVWRGAVDSSACCVRPYGMLTKHSTIVLVLRQLMTLFFPLHTTTRSGSTRNDQNRTMLTKHSPRDHTYVGLILLFEVC